MRIGFDVSYIQKRRAGVGRYSIELLRALVALNPVDEFVLHGWSSSLDRGVLDSLAGGRVTLRVSRVPGNLKRFMWDHLRIPPLRLLTGPIDVFQSCDPFLPALGGIRAVSTVHDLCQRIVPEYFDRRVMRRDKYLERSIANADAIIVPSHQTRADLLAMFPVRAGGVHVIYPPLSMLFHPPGEGDGVRDGAVRDRLHLPGRFLFFAGTIEPRKNIVSLVRAFEHADRALPGALSLVIAGKPGWYYHDVFRAIEASPLRNRIRYLKYVADGDLACLYRLAHLFVYPSHYEGFGYPVVEAMASGTPVITSKSSSLGEVALGGAELVDPSDPDALTQAIVDLAHDEDRRTTLGESGVRRAQWISSQNPGAQVGAIYRRLAAMD